ncbi:MAG: DUF4397 domain-containing protein [Candidatus Aminicenantaceae bacterium]
MKKRYLWVLVSVFFVGLFSIGLNAQEEEASDQAIDDASVYIVHGVPGLDIGEEATYPVDIYINGTKRLSAIKYGQIKRVKIPSGTASIEFYKVGMGPEAGYPPVISGNFIFKKQETASIVAYLHPDGEVRFVKFTNDFSPAGDPSKCRVIVHNTSEEAQLLFYLYNKRQKDNHPWVENDVLETGDKNVFEIAKQSLVGYYNGTWIWWLHLDDGTHMVNVYDKPLSIKAGKGILVYLVGSRATKTFKVIKKVVPLK